MSAKVGPGVVCFIVPPPGDGCPSIRNAVCTVVRLFLDGDSIAGVSLRCVPPSAKAWVVRVSQPLSFPDGVLPRQSFTEFPVYESWLRPISGPDIDTSEKTPDPVHSLINEEAGA